MSLNVIISPFKVSNTSFKAASENWVGSSEQLKKLINTTIMYFNLFMILLFCDKMFTFAEMKKLF